MKVASLRNSKTSGIWTRARISQGSPCENLDGRPTPATAGPSTSASDTPGVPGHSSSPRWQIEDEDPLPEDDEDIFS